MGFGHEISKQLTQLLAATAVCGASAAIAPQSALLAIVESVLGAAAIGHTVWQNRSARMDVVLRRCTGEIDAAADGWLAGEFASNPDAAVLRDQAIEAIKEVLPLVVPRAGELVAARITERNVAAFYTARAAAVRPAAFADTSQNAMARFLFGEVIGKAYGVIVRQPEFAADMLRHTLAEVLEGQDAHTAMLQELLALARSSGAQQRAAEQGIPEAAVRAIVLRLGGEGIDSNDLVAWLDNWIAAASEQLAKQSNEGEAFEAAREEAWRRFRAGRIKDASAAFMDELAREERQEAARQAERKHHRVRLLEEAISFDELAFDAPAAVAKLRLMADIEGVAGADARGAWIDGKANEFYERGRDKGINAALAIAIAGCRAALEEWTRERVPLDWAATQNNLGTALATLGERESGTARLEDAVAAYRAALEEWTRERVPLAWATAQNNLGNALWGLGERESGTARLEEAVAAHRSALEERTREHVPSDWATSQNNLGTALGALGARETGTARLEEAVAAYRAALEEWKRGRVPHDWAMAENNLGTALQTLGARESGTARLEQAVAAYRAALEERTREREPLDWATTQNNLGTALRMLGERESGTARLEEAVAACRAALEERTRERVPLDWAGTQNNLGNALARLGARESGTARLEEAVAAYRAALEERTRDRVPLDWAMTQNNLGNALRTLGERESGTARLRQAVAAYRAALEEWTRERVPLDWAMTQNNLGNALRTLGERESGTARLRQAVAAWDECLTVVATAWPAEWVQGVRANRDAVLALIAERSVPNDG